MGMPIAQLVKTTHQSKNTLLRLIYQYLDQPPQLLPRVNPDAFLVIDATWFGRENCLLVYWDTAFKKVQWWRYTNRKEVKVFSPLATAGISLFNSKAKNHGRIKVKTAGRTDKPD